MGRPPGSKNGVKKAAGKKQANGAGPTPAREAPRKQAAAPSASAGKPNQPTPEQNAEWLARYTRLKTEAQRVAGDISALGSQVKAAGGPMRWKSIKRVHDMGKLDPSEAKAELEDLVIVAAQNDIRVNWMGNQATFADVMEQEQAKPPPKNTKGTHDLASAKAESDGYNSGMHGAVPSDNPFSNAPGSIEYVSWHNGRDDGQRDRDNKKPGEASRAAAAKTADATLPDDAPIF